MPSGLTTVNASRIQDASGALLNNAVISFTPIAGTGTPLSFRAGASGQVLATSIIANVVNGRFSLSLADTSQTSPVNVGYKVEISAITILSPTYSDRGTLAFSHRVLRGRLTTISRICPAWHSRPRVRLA